MDTVSIDPLASEPTLGLPTATIDVYFVERSADGKTWQGLTHHPNGKTVGLFFSMEEAETLVAAWLTWHADPMPGIKVKTSPMKLRVVKVVWLGQVVKEEF